MPDLILVEEEMVAQAMKESKNDKSDHDPQILLQ